MPSKLLPDHVIQRISEHRIKQDIERARESIERERAIRKGKKIAEEIERLGLVIRPEEVKQCCGNIPSIGVSRGMALIYCPWCKKESKGVPLDVIKDWNSK